MHERRYEVTVQAKQDVEGYDVKSIPYDYSAVFEEVGTFHEEVATGGNHLGWL